MAEVLALARRVEPHASRGTRCRPRAPSPRAPRRSRRPSIENASRPVRPSDSRLSPGRYWSGRIAHHQQVRAVDALVALRDHRADAEQLRPLRGPVARRAGAVLLAGEHDRAACPRRGSARRPRRSSSPRPSAGAPSTSPREPGTSRLRSRTFANVPRTITSWLPRREPYELKSLRSTPCSTR